MIVKLLTEHHLEFLSLKGDCRGSSEYKHVMSKCHIIGNLMQWLIINFNEVDMRIYLPEKVIFTEASFRSR